MIIDITPHTGGILCACKDCRHDNDNERRVPTKMPVTVAETPTPSIGDTYSILEYKLKKFVSKNGKYEIYEYGRTR